MFSLYFTSETADFLTVLKVTSNRDVIFQPNPTICFLPCWYICNAVCRYWLEIHCGDMSHGYCSVNVIIHGLNSVMNEIGSHRTFSSISIMLTFSLLTAKCLALRSVQTMICTVRYSVRNFSIHLVSIKW